MAQGVSLIGARARARMARTRHLVPLAILALTLPPLAHQLLAADPAAVGAAVAAVSAPAMLGALAATALGFLAVGRYDAGLHRWLGTGVDGATAARVGAASVALSQTLGFGLVTGALARWRGLPQIGLLDAARVTGAVAATFLAALAVVVLVTVAVFGAPEGAPDWIALPGLAVLVLVPVAALAPHRLRGMVPPLSLMGALLAVAFVDVGAAAAAFWLFLPADPAFAVATVLPAFVLALAAGIASGTPGGVGPFEITLLTLLPQAPQAELLAAVLGFRLVYYALPAALGALWLATRPGAEEPGAARPALPEATLAAAPRAEAGLVRLGELAPLCRDGATLIAGVTAQAVVAVGDPVIPVDPARAVSALAQAAADRARRPLFYKCGGRVAAAARAAGWCVLPVAEEAWLAPAAFRADAPGRQRLRRKLKAARAAGLEVARARALPFQEMAELSDDWARRHGGERGFSMGRFAPAYVAGQHVWLARRDGRLEGFVTFHGGAREWTLDLVRVRDGAPDGTVFALVAAAIADAAAAGVPRLSLAALPAPRPGPPLPGTAGRRAAGEGLRQFKSAFGPSYETLYAAAPGRLSLALGLWDVLWRVHRPLPLPAPQAEGQGAA